MFTEFHSEALAVWALRARVWNYFIKPVCITELSTQVDSLFQIRASHKPRVSRGNYMPPPPVPTKIANPFRAVEENSVEPAIEYILNNYPEKVLEHDLAALCGMSVFHFSRVFKRETGKTFREYLLEFRVMEAKRLLEETAANVTEILFSVGFNDPSHFTRLFKRQVGVPPLQYRKQRQGHSSDP